MRSDQELLDALREVIDDHHPTKGDAIIAVGTVLTEIITQIAEEHRGRIIDTVHLAIDARCGMGSVPRTVN